MDVQHYPMWMGQNQLNYNFYSVGPKGKILKAIWFRQVEFEPNRIFNVSLGDVDDITNEIKGNVISNNSDVDRVLMTVGQSVIIFCKRFPDAYVTVRGSTPARTRLYRMVISSRLTEIRRKFILYGLFGLKAELFRKNQNYDGFMVKAL